MLARTSFFFAVIITATAQLSVPPCYRDDPNVNECIRNFLNNLKPLLRDGIKELGILSPMVIDFLNITHTSPNNHFNMIFKNFTVYNIFNNYEFTQFALKGIDVTTNVKFGEIKIESDYTLDGTMMGVKAQGAGFLTGKSDSSQAKVDIKKKLIRKQEVEYCQVLRVKSKLKTSTPSIHLSGLHSDLTNEVLNGNPKELRKLVSVVLGKVLSSLVQKYLGLLCDIVPYELIIPRHP